MTRPNHPGPLASMRVLELAQIMAGPTCGMLLADMGADVIKVEKLPGGDDTRSYTEPSVGGESAAFMILNRNKRGIAANLKTPGGLEVVKKLLRDADVVTENYRKGTLEKLGLGYDVLHKLNPRLVYCAVSGYGRTGPYADKPGFDPILQGFARSVSVTGAIGRAELIDDARFKTNGDRMKNLDALVPLISERTRTRSSAEWIREFEAAGVPVGPINKIGDVLADPQVKAREMVVEVEHSRVGTTKAIGLPIKFSE